VGHRLSKIYTRTGDDGTTGLADGTRVSKYDDRIEACGAVDETNSAVGLVLAEDIRDTRLREALEGIQHKLFDLGAEFSLPDYEGITREDVEALEVKLDQINGELPPLKEFVLPGGNRAAATCHLARSIARRAERSAWRLSANADVNPACLHFLNRLSDFLFVAARVLSRQEGESEVMWKKRAE
jgi:cob(I)alamin adenosyltransferase